MRPDSIEMFEALEETMERMVSEGPVAEPEVRPTAVPGY